MEIAAQTPRGGVRYCEDEYRPWTARKSSSSPPSGTSSGAPHRPDQSAMKTPVMVDLRNIYEPATMRT
jgi:hypothetical protein